MNELTESQRRRDESRRVLNALAAEGRRLDRQLIENKRRREDDFKFCVAEKKQKRKAGTILKSQWEGMTQQYEQYEDKVKEVNIIVDYLEAQLKKLDDERKRFQSVEKHYKETLAQKESDIEKLERRLADAKSTTQCGKSEINSERKNILERQKKKEKNDEALTSNESNCSRELDKDTKHLDKNFESRLTQQLSIARPIESAVSDEFEDRMKFIQNTLREIDEWLGTPQSSRAKDEVKDVEGEKMSLAATDESPPERSTRGYAVLENLNASMVLSMLGSQVNWANRKMLLERYKSCMPITELKADNGNGSQTSDNEHDQPVERDEAQSKKLIEDKLDVANTRQGVQQENNETTPMRGAYGSTKQSEQIEKHLTFFERFKPISEQSELAMKKLELTLQPLQPLQFETILPLKHFAQQTSIIRPQQLKQDSYPPTTRADEEWREMLTDSQDKTQSGSHASRTHENSCTRKASNDVATGETWTTLPTQPTLSRLNPFKFRYPEFGESIQAMHAPENHVDDAEILNNKSHARQQQPIFTKINSKMTTSAANNVESSLPEEPVVHSSSEDARLIHTLKTLVTGVAVLNQSLFVVSEMNSVVEVYDPTTFTFSGKVSVEGLTNPQFLTSCPLNACLYILDRTQPNNVIYRLGLGPDWRHHKWSIGTDFGALASTSSGSLLLSCFDLRIKNFSSSGELIRQFQFGHDPTSDIRLFGAVPLPRTSGISRTAKISKAK